MTDLQTLQTKLASMDEAALQAVTQFIEDRERKIAADAEYLQREAETQKLLDSLSAFADDWTEEEFLGYEMAVKGFNLRSADAEANAREARLFARMLDGLTAEEKINALLDASQGRDPYVLDCLRLIRTITEPMNWAQERAFDIALMTQPWHKLERFGRGGLASFALALAERMQVAAQRQKAQPGEDDNQIQKEQQ